MDAADQTRQLTAARLDPPAAAAPAELVVPACPPTPASTPSVASLNSSPLPSATGTSGSPACMPSADSSPGATAIMWPSSPIEPAHMAAYIEELRAGYERPTVKQHLAAIRMLFDWLVTGHVVAVNPATSVRGPKHVVKRGRTTVVTGDQARALLASVPLTRMVKLRDGTIQEAPCLVGPRDRTLISMMTYAFGRISAVLGMRVDDYDPQGKRWWVRLQEEGGRRHPTERVRKITT